MLLFTVLIGSLFLAFASGQNECADVDSEMCQMEKDMNEDSGMSWVYRCATDEWLRNDCNATCNLCAEEIDNGGNECEDRDQEWCTEREKCMSKYDFYGYSCKYDDQYQLMCQKTCKLCPEDPDCFDMDKEYCKMEKENYDMSSMSWVYGCETDPWLSEQCAKSCRLCGGEGSGDGPADDCYDKDTEFCTKKSQCDMPDIFYGSDCLYDDMAMTVCQKTCGLCGEVKCEDKAEEYCAEQKEMYAEWGMSFVYDCQNYQAEYLGAVCPASCKLCGEDNGECTDLDQEFCAYREKQEQEMGTSFADACSWDDMLSSMCQLSCNLCGSDNGIGSGSGSGMLGPVGSGNGMFVKK